MRVILILPILLLAISAAANSKWEFVGRNDINDIFYIDSNSYQKSGDSITYWAIRNYGERDKWGDLSSKNQYTINCRTREVITRYLITYDDRDSNGKITDSFASKSSWSPIAPDTINWSIMKHVCK